MVCWKIREIDLETSQFSYFIAKTDTLGTFLPIFADSLIGSIFLAALSKSQLEVTRVNDYFNM